MIPPPVELTHSLICPHWCLWVNTTNPLFWRFATPWTGPDHIFSYLAVLTLGILSALFSWKQGYRYRAVPLGFCDAIFAMGVGNLFADFIIIHSLVLSSSPLAFYTMPLYAFAIRVMLLGKKPASLGKYLYYVMALSIPYIIWNYFLGHAVDFIGQTHLTQYWMTPWVSGWEIGIWWFNVTIFYILVVRSKRV